MSSRRLERLEDVEYRRAYGAERAKLEVAVAFAQSRESTGTTQSALAERADVTQAYIAKLERGDANPTIGQLGSLMAVLWLKPVIAWDFLVSGTTNAVRVEGSQPASSGRIETEAVGEVRVEEPATTGTATPVLVA